MGKKATSGDGGARGASIDTGNRVVIEGVRPELDGGRYQVKREVGDVLDVEATIYLEGHDKISAVVKHRKAGTDAWDETPMEAINPGLDLWRGSFELPENAVFEYTIEAWPDAYGSWTSEIAKKSDAGQDVGLELIEGQALIDAAMGRAQNADKKNLERVVRGLDAADDDEERYALFQARSTIDLMWRCADRGAAARYPRVLEVFVDRVAARFAAWYEMFHRSQGTTLRKPGTFADCELRLPEIKAMGFDVIYFVPIHPIGRKHRKGPNNTLKAGPKDPGSPYAIGAKEGGHKAVNPELGTLEDFDSFVEACHAYGMEVALDFAIQCAPDHPWITEHPEWFIFRPDGTIKYAENPPKKYQDIVNVNFYGPHQEALWQELLSVVLFWVDHGVKIFRVDNPHTKPVAFWEWLIREVRKDHPDVLFLSEAFTRPPMLKMLAKIGYTQSYTYFTWRDFKPELTEYLEELTQTEVKEYLRPNFFANTPDILPGFLQRGGRPAFMIRLVLAATLSSVYGIYNGFELCENEAVEGTEEYLNSEKYDYKVWDWDRPGNIKDYVTAVNRIRRENPALQELDNLRFYSADDDNVLFYGKMTPEKDSMVFVAVNLDPFETHEARLEFPLEEMGLEETDTYSAEELLHGGRHLWRGARHFVRLDPEENPAAIFRVTPWQGVDFRSPCY